MLMKEFNMEEVMAVRYEDGIIRGRIEGREEGIAVTARNALAEGFSVEAIHKITGLSIDAIASLAEKCTPTSVPT